MTRVTIGGFSMDSIYDDCRIRWLALKSVTNLIRLKRENGLTVTNDKAYACRLLEELRLYHDCDLMPEGIRDEFEAKIPEFRVQ